MKSKSQAVTTQIFASIPASPPIQYFFTKKIKVELFRPMPRLHRQVSYAFISVYSYVESSVGAEGFRAIVSVDLALNQKKKMWKIE